MKPAKHLDPSSGLTREEQRPDSAPLVSIIIPCYNYATYVGDAVESALTQDYGRVEVIVVDDGSTDGSGELLRTRFAERIRYILKENRGLSAARNTGIQAATGEFLVFLDADDVLYPAMVSSTMKALEEGGPEWGLIATKGHRIDQAGRPLPDLEKPEYWTDREISRTDILIRNPFSTMVLTRRCCFELCGMFDEDLKACEDRDMWIRISERFRILQLGQAYSSTRRHGTNMSSNARQQCDAILRVLNKTRKRAPFKGVANILWLKIYSFFLFQRAWLYYESNKPFAALNFIGSILLWPLHLDFVGMRQKKHLFRLRALLSMVRR